MSTGNIKLSTSKLIALWAFSECALGGILHAFQFPFSGLLLAGFAVTIICAIGFSSEKPAQDILYGTLVAMAVKLALSPHSPVTAYVAVGFQGLLGALFFRFQQRNKWAYIIFGAIALLESALQKVLTLTIIFGNALWESIDISANHLVKTLGGKEEIDFAILILGVYSCIYLIWGGIVGLWAYRIPDKINSIDRNSVNKYADSHIETNFKKRKVYGFLILCFIMMISVYAFMTGGNKENLTWIIVRPLIIIVSWYFIFHPFFLFLIKLFIKNKGNRLATVVENISTQIPHLRKITQQAAGYSTANYSGFERIRYFIVILILLACEEGDNN